MSHALVTIVCPLAASRLVEAEIAIGRLGNPATGEIRKALDTLTPDDPSGIHFASMHAIQSTGEGSPYLLFEFSADGSNNAAIKRITASIGSLLRPIFSLASDWRDGGNLEDYLIAHQFSVGGGWLDNPGIAFAGAPGMTVGRIRSEASLVARITSLLGAQPGHLTALQRVVDVRGKLGSDPALSPAISEGEFVPAAGFGEFVSIGAGFIVTYLWPVVVAVLGWALFSGVFRAQAAPSFDRGVLYFAGGFLSGLWLALWIGLIVVLVVLAVVYLQFRKAEDHDWVDDRIVERDVNEKMFARENIFGQNHMISITRRKPGVIRSFTSRLFYWGLGQATGLIFPPGFLGSIGTIHFARWVTPPGTRDVVFLSNYDGSWESYLEDFITLAHQGLTAVWSNTMGFPRTENLIQKGATDGERFKRFARHSMKPTLFWYSAYPDLTTGAIRTNKKIRRGLSGVMTEDEANAWLALFGSSARPVTKLINTEIQSLIFGGLGFMEHGVCLIHDLPGDLAKARKWLNQVSPDIAFNDGRRLGRRAVITLALGAKGLERLGLPADAIATFPYAFLEGMTGEARARILGDTGPNAKEKWRWGKEHQPDVALLLYGESKADVEQLEEKVMAYARDAGVGEPHRIALKEITKDKTEPFGFVDGISQPAIRGTYKGLRAADPIHLVEPGEFILGYPDNRGNLPPGPILNAIDDPENLLPLIDAVKPGFGQTAVTTPRAVGFNGSFLVIRELEQDVNGFKKFCEEQACELDRSGRLSPPYNPIPEFIAAKLVGRWYDGSSLARFPYESRTHENERRKTNLTTRPTPNVEHGGEAVARPLESGPKIDNNFLFGTEDPEGMRCPFGAHIRRANPRDSLAPGSADQISISNRHRTIRVGRPYIPAQGKNPGILFMCLNGDIERQFEFLQQTWLRAPSFHGLSCEKDPLLGDAQQGVCNFTIPTREGPVRLASLPQFVTTRGGGYFFLPGKRLIDYLRAARG
jgi:deferrochelatase/peroxidase EfeB